MVKTENWKNRGKVIVQRDAKGRFVSWRKPKPRHRRGHGFTGFGFIGGKRVAIYGYASVDGGRRSRRFEFSGSGRDLYRAIRVAHRVVPSNRQRSVTVSAREFLRAPYRYGVEGGWVEKEIES
jgi:hypothetical protein